MPDDPNAVPDALEAIAIQLKELGKGNAATKEGAIELLSKSIRETNKEIAAALGYMADAIDRLGESIEKTALTK